jgi:hypothetical protein
MFAAFNIASVLATAAMYPLVSTMPRASACPRVATVAISFSSVSLMVKV